MNSIPCTVSILTHNSGKTLARALESVKDFSEIIICDSGSTDNTLEIAHKYGARIITQDKQYLDKDGRIIDFAGVRNQCLKKSTQDWFFFLDSDEYIGSDLVEEVREKVSKEPAAYWVPRKYVYKGVVVDCSVTYPSQQMRFFHSAVAQQFFKPVHEKIFLKEGVTPQWMTYPMFVPTLDTAREMIIKWRGYIAIERANRTPISLSQWIRSTAREVGIAGLYTLRFLRIVVTCRGTRLPIAHEFARIWYQYALIRDSFKMIKL